MIYASLRTIRKEKDSDSEEERLQSNGDSIPWKAFKTLVTKNKAVKDKVQEPLNSFIGL